MRIRQWFDNYGQLKPVRRLDPDEHQVVKLESEELESKFGIIRDRYEK